MQIDDKKGIKIYKEYVSGDIEGNFISEAFGIDRGYSNVVLNLTLPNELGDIIYVTGESGCGKSTLLKELSGEYIATPTPPTTELYKWGGEDFENSLYILSSVGLGDAVLFTSTYNMLSDSQQMRALIYWNILQNKEVFIFDEFLSTLDRGTAYAVSFTFQKLIRKLGKKAIVATAHSDLEEYLQPDCVIKGSAFPSSWEVIKRDKEITNPFISKLEYKYEDKEWYRELRLGELHYKGKYTGGVKEYLGCFYNDKVIGVLVSTYRMSDGGRRISRLVVHPSYRGCGIGVELVKRYIKDFPSVDVLASMAKYNPVFDKAGMTYMGLYTNKPIADLQKELVSSGFNLNKWHSREYCLIFMGDKVNREILIPYASRVGHLVTPAGKTLSTVEIIEKLRNEDYTAGRVLWGLRPRELARYKHLPEKKGGTNND